MKFWYWSQPAVAILLLALISYTVVNFVAFYSTGLFSIQFAINGLFFFPGLLLSLGLNQWLLSRRTPRAVTTPERWLLGFEYGLVVVLVATSFAADALLIGLVLWPLLIVLAIVIGVAIPVMTARLARPEEASPWSAAAGPDDGPSDGLDELLGR